MKKGQATITVLMSIASLLGSGMGIGFLYNSVAEAQKVNANQGERISTVETKVERISYLEAKIDKLLEKNGVNPNSIKVATTTNET